MTLYKLSTFSASIACCVSMVIMISGCAVHESWYHPQSLQGHSKSGQCGTAGKKDVWVLERENVDFGVNVSAAKPGYRGQAVVISLKVPASRTVEMWINAIQVSNKKGRNLISHFFVSSGYVEGNSVRLPKDIHFLSGSTYATKRVPNTYYVVSMILKKELPSVINIELPRMEINGHEYPPLTIHFTKKPGTYFVMGVNC